MHLTKSRYNFAVLEVVVPAVAWLLLASVAGKFMLHPIHDGDTWWHMASGRAIAESHRLIREDIFSHTLAGTPWIDFEWLSEIGMYGLAKTFGVRGVYWAKALLGCSVLVVLVGSLILAGARGPLLFSLTWLGYEILRVRLCTRVEILSLNFLPLFIIVVVLALRQQDAFPKRAAPWILSSLMAIWCNLHGGFGYGLVVLALFSVGSRAAGFDYADTAWLDRSLVFCLVAALVNPFGPRIFEVFAQHMVDFRRAPGLISEWDAPRFQSASHFWICYGASAFFIIQAILKKRRSLFFWIPAVIGFSVLGGMSQRNTPFLAFVALPFIAESVNGQAWSEKIGAKNPFLWLALWLLNIGFMHRDLQYLFKEPMPQSIVDESTIPSGACNFIKQQKIDGVLFNTYGFGGYISWALGPAWKIFMDGRYIFYPLLEEYEFLMDGRKHPITEKLWQTYFNKYRIDHAVCKYEPLRLLTSGNHPFNHESVMDFMFPRSTWALVYWNDASLVFLKRLPKFSETIQKTEYRFLRPYDMERMVNERVAGKLAVEETEKELKRHAKEVGVTRKGRQMWTLMRLPLPVAFQNHLHSVSNQRDSHGTAAKHR